MNVTVRKARRRKGQAPVRTVLFLGGIAAGSLGYFLASGNRVEAIVLPAIAVALAFFGVGVYSRARKRREWSSAWEAYAAQGAGRSPHGRVPAYDEFSSSMVAN
jgi:hypothetical protein